MNTGKIGIILPVFNVEKYLHRCLDSILNQKDTNFILIAVNDGSRDNSGEILDKYAERDPRIIVKHTENHGHAAARNAGIEIAFTIKDVSWLTFIDSDDWIDKNYLKFLIEAAEKFNTNIVIGNYERVFDEKEVSHIPDTLGNGAEEIIPQDFWCNNRITATIPCGKLFYKSLFSTIRFPNKVHDDEHMTYKLLFSQEKIAYITYPIYHYFYNANSVMSSGWSPKHLDSIDAIRERREFFQDNGFEKAADFDSKLLINELYDSILELEKMGAEHTKTIKDLKKILLKELRQDKRFKFEQYSYMWVKAHPKYKLKYYYNLLKRRLT